LTVSGVRADAGIALDGDGDRLVMADHLGRTVDGDQLLYVLARARLAAGGLAGPVVGTVMSNLGLELALKDLGIDFLRAAVGDRNVLQLLRTHSGMLGGESSGHLLVLDKTTTGDGLIVALQVLAVMKTTGKSLAELGAGMQRFPQQLINVRVAQRFDAAREPGVAAAIARVERSLGERGRVVLRASGTEPLIRVMVEGEDAQVVARHAEELAAAVRAAEPAA
jgi:phosphoglucosamine mutase